VDVQGTEPHRIVKVDLQPGVRVPVSIQRVTQTELIKEVRFALDKSVTADRFAGAVLAAKNGKAFFARAYGLANRERGAPNTLDTRFRIGSMNKMFTAVATLTLVQDGKLALEDPIGKYLTDYPNKTFAAKVTIHQLLTHTGGTGDFFGPEFMAHRLELRTHQDYVQLFGARDLLFEPGSRWMYSNFGFILLGAVIEKVSGQSYYDYVRDHVYKPSGMTSTGSDPEQQAPANLAVGYMKRPGAVGWQPDTDTLPYRGTAAGGGYTTVRDLLQFSSAVLKHKLLNAHYTDLLTTGKVPAMGGKYAYGFIEHVRDGIRSVGHGGTAPGMSGDLVIFPDSGCVIVVLANMDPPAAQRISDFIANRLPTR
jgi:CubicO group peptidase (beta-lactamase class C family)